MRLILIKFLFIYCLAISLQGCGSLGESIRELFPGGSESSESDEYAQIRYDEDSEVCFINIDLVKEISSFFSLESERSKEVIGMWVENTLQMKVTDTIDNVATVFSALRIPSK